MFLLLFILLVLPSPSLVMTSSPRAAALWRNRVSSINACQQMEAVGGGLTIRCSGLRLTQVCTSGHSFYKAWFSCFLWQLSSLEAGCFFGLASSLRYLDLSFNRLTTLDPAVLSGLQVLANLTQNPWHCDCRMQMSIPQLDVDQSSLEKVICQTSDLPNLGAVGLPLVVLVEDWDLCQSVRRTSEVVTMVTMFVWFSMLISYLFYYIQQNQAVARRHLEYLKFLESRDPFRPR